MATIRDAVLECLDHAPNDRALIRALEDVIAKEGRGTYRVILHILTHLELDQREAADCWREIIALHQEMSAALKRPVSLRTAICDYFCSVHKSLKNPKVVEIHIFETTLKNSKYDGLTGLLNRLTLEEMISREINRARRHTEKLSMIFFDLDNFKQVNDCFGHQAGDAFLKQVAAVIQSEKRLEDMAGRYGGEEMLLLLPETHKKNAAAIGERIRSRVEKTVIQWQRSPIRATVSGGLSVFPDEARDAASLVRQADEALQRAKAAGKNRIV